MLSGFPGVGSALLRQGAGSRLDGTGIQLIILNYSLHSFESDAAAQAHFF